MASGYQAHANQKNLLDTKFTKIRAEELEKTGKPTMERLSRYFTIGVPMQETMWIGDMAPMATWTTFTGRLEYGGPTEGYTSNANPKVYAKGLGIERYLVDHSLFTIVERFQRYLVQSGFWTLEETAADVINKLWTNSTSYFTLSEAVAPISSSHTSPVSGADTSVGFDNRENSLLSPVTLKNALIKGRKFRNNVGFPLRPMRSFRTLLVPPDREHEAEEIRQTAAGVWGDPSDNTKNVLQNRFSIQVWNLLSSTTRCILFDLERWKEMAHFDFTVRPEFAAEENFENFVAKYRGYFDHTIMLEPNSWRTIVGIG